MSDHDHVFGAALLAFALIAVPIEAAPITYVHPAAPSCSGSSPCYKTMHAAIQNVDNGGTVIVLANLTDYLGDTFSKVGVTLKGNTPSITITGGVNVVSSVTTGWTIRDLVFTAGFRVANLATSLTVQNVSTTGMLLGSFTQNPNAAITVQGCTFPGGPGALISIQGSNGVDIGGTITIADNINVYAVNIFTFVGAGDPANLDANITISGNQLSRGVNIIVNSDGTVGTGNVTGSIQFLNNAFSPIDGLLGVIINGNASGNITGAITFTGNVGGGLVVNMADSAVGGTVGPVTMTGNDIELLEIVAWNRPLVGPVLINGNNVVDKGGRAAGSPYMALDGMPITGNVTVQNTTGAAALISTESSGTGSYSGVVRIIGNSARRMIIDSRGGSITQPLTIANNTLPPAGGVDSTLTIRTLAGGSMAGGSIIGNALDGVQFALAGGLAGPLSLAFNSISELTSLINSGPVGPGTSTLEGNWVRGTTYLQGMNTVARFNNLGGSVTFVAGATVDARHNWWGCNGGPGSSAYCATGYGSAPVWPWLTFHAQTRCTSGTSAIETVDLLSASDGSRPAGNTTPAAVTVTSTQGSVAPPVVYMTGSGTATVTLPAPAAPTITSSLGYATVAWPAACSPDPTTVALYVPSGGRFLLSNRNATGVADAVYTFGLPGQTPLMGDWDGDGVKSPGVYDRATGQFLLRNSNTGGGADIAFTFGLGGAGWLPIVGDWNGDGIDTVGLYVPSTSVFYLRNTNTSGYADIAFSYGVGGAGWLPVTGDWNGDGIDTVGLYVPAQSVFYLRNTNTSGYADVAFSYGVGGAGWLPITGDWNGDGIDTVGLYVPAQSVFYLRNTNTSGFADVAFAYGVGGAGWLPVTGDFDGP
jgi:hypothetical protein